MHAFVRILLCWLLWLPLVVLAQNLEGTPTPRPQLLQPPAPPELSARGYLLMDFDSGEVLAERNADAPLEPASLTKLMTVHVALGELARGALNLDDEVTVSEKAWRTIGSRMFIEVDTRVRVSDLLRGIIIQSGNDASVALAEHIAGSEAAFAQMMNDEAARLGMTRTRFRNATGLPDDGHITTARDMAKAAAAIIREFPEYYAWYSEREFTYNGIRQKNRNRLLGRTQGVDGLKTGHTEAAGFCLVSSAERDGQRLISVVMGTGSDEARMRDSENLLNYGFRFFETHRLFDAGQLLTQLRVYLGKSKHLDAGPARDLFVTIPRGGYEAMNATLVPNGTLEAPIAVGEIVGEIEVRLGDSLIKTVPAIALTDIPEAGFFKRGVDTLMQRLGR